MRLRLIRCRETWITGSAPLFLSPPLEYVNAYTRYLQHLAECPRDWRRHEIGFDTVLEMTPEEMEELEKDLNELITRWTERTSPQSRPSSPNEGRRQVLVTIQGFAWQP